MAAAKYLCKLESGFAHVQSHNEAEWSKFCVRFNTSALFAEAREHADVTAQIKERCDLWLWPPKDVFIHADIY